MTRRPDNSSRRGVAAIAMIAMLLVVHLIVIGMVIGGARDHDLTVRRAESVRAFYAAEAGMNMAIRELMEYADEDGDGTIGSISDDGDPANDPTLGSASVSVSQDTDIGVVTVTSTGVSGEAQREFEAVLQ